MVAFLWSERDKAGGQVGAPTLRPGPEEGSPRPLGEHLLLYRPCQYGTPRGLAPLPPVPVRLTAGTGLVGGLTAPPEDLLSLARMTGK